MAIVNYLMRRQEQVWSIFVDHLAMSLAAIVVAIIVGVSLGIIIANKRQWAGPVVAAANVVQTIPALALFALLMPVIGIGNKAGVVAVTLYAILPILKNTYTGITDVDQNVVEAGRGLGMTTGQLLFKVQLPLAVPVMMAGVRTAAVLTVSLVTLVALIGGGGLGKVIYSGINKVDNTEIMAGALLAAGLAIITDILLGIIERRLRWESAGGVKGGES